MTGLRAWLDRLRPNSVAANVRTWSRWDWRRGGEEWTPTAAWKASFLAHVLQPAVPRGSRVLEIGPGGGRWTEALLERASHVTAVDVTPACIAACRERFGERADLRLILNDGRELSGVASGSVDVVWSFDVFVHIRAYDAEAYIAQLPRVLSPGGRGVIHHARCGRHAEGWRSDLTAGRMREACEGAGLRVERQFSAWDEGRASLHGGSDGPDVITVLGRG